MQRIPPSPLLSLPKGLSLWEGEEGDKERALVLYRAKRPHFGRKDLPIDHAGNPEPGIPGTCLLWLN